MKKKRGRPSKISREEALTFLSYMDNICRDRHLTLSEACEAVTDSRYAMLAVFDLVVFGNEEVPYHDASFIEGLDGRNRIRARLAGDPGWSSIPLNYMLRPRVLERLYYRLRERYRPDL